jgi:hypothetical protein
VLDEIKNREKKWQEIEKEGLWEDRGNRRKGEQMQLHSSL